jgi:hypothetical protein
MADAMLRLRLTKDIGAHGAAPTHYIRVKQGKSPRIGLGGGLNHLPHYARLSTITRTTIMLGTIQ